MARRDNPLEYGPAGDLYLGSRIRELRQRKGWRLEEMARLMSYHPASLSKVENNAARPSNRMLQRIAELLEAPVEELRGATLHPRTTREILSETPSLAPADMEACLAPSPPLPSMPRARFFDVGSAAPSVSTHGARSGSGPPPAMSITSDPERTRYAASLREAPPVSKSAYARPMDDRVQEVAAEFARASRRLDDAWERFSAIAVASEEARRVLSTLLDKEQQLLDQLSEIARELERARDHLATLLHEETGSR